MAERRHLTDGADVSGCATFETGTVASPPARTTLEGDEGLRFWLELDAADPVHAEALELFLPFVVLPDATGLEVGSRLRVEGRRLPSGVVVLERLGRAPTIPDNSSSR